MGNVPDDWNCYWYTCEFCGEEYHGSDGGCDCGGSYCDKCEIAIAEDDAIYKWADDYLCSNCYDILMGQEPDDEAR